MEDNIWFYGGDFNITPDSRTYQYLKTQNGCIWNNYLKKYPITNHAFIRQYEFSGCIDYIFYSINNLIKKKIECIEVKYNMVEDIIPNNNNPSDHIPIYCKFKII
jgi:mRNA deadenylase 3'-5' endonuclease subunit Ccr4